MGQKPRSIIEAAQDGNILEANNRERFDTGGSKAVTLPATGVRDSLEDVETFSCYYDPASGAVVYLPADDENNGE